MIKKIFIGIGILLTVILVGSGWYFSGLIYEIGFNINNQDNLDAGTAEDNIVVEQINENTVLLDVKDELWGPLLENGIYGVLGQNGFMVVSDIIEEKDGIVERKIDYQEGNLVVGERVSYSLSLVENSEGNYVPVGASGWSGQATEGIYTPMSVSKLDYEEVTYTSTFSEYPAFLTNTGEDGWVIFIHGFRGNYQREVFALLRAQEIEEIGWKSMIIAYRNDAGMKQDPSGMYQYGATEWEDVDGAIKYARQNGAKSVVLWGVSGGGGPVASWLQNSSDKSLVDGVILEAPTFNFIESVEVNGQARFPWLPESLFDYYTWLAEVRFGIDFDSMDYREAVIDSTVPMLLFHGDDDEWIPVSLSDFIASKRDENLIYMRYENVGHVQAWNADPELYIKTVSNFLTSLEK